MSPFFTLFVSAFCGDCDWNVRAENPTPSDQARIVRQAQAHQAATGHNVAIERGQSYYGRGG
jgi:hypothetical protein